MEPFSFEHTFQFDEKSYVQLNSLFKRNNRAIRLTMFILIGISCLFWKYTMVVGIAILFTAIICFWAEAHIPNTVANNYRTMPYLREELSYGVTEKNLWIKGKQLSIEFSWELAVVWDKRGEWLKISANHTPPIWFKINQLKDKGIYDRIIHLCTKHAVRCSS